MLAVPSEVRKKAQRVVEDGIGQMEGLKGSIEGISRFVNVAHFTLKGLEDMLGTPIEATGDWH